MQSVKSALVETLPQLGFSGPENNLWTREADNMKVYNLGPFTNIYRGEELVEVFDEDAFKAPKRDFMRRLESLCA